MKGRVWQVGQTVRGGTRAATQRWADLFGGWDSDGRSLPGQKTGQKRRLSWGADRGGDGSRGGVEGGCCRRVGPIPLLILFYVLLPGSDGDGLKCCSMND